ncbi:hypothetical protein Lesp02_83980 [Lentzea sp. NBRC 105346]|uniref:hypothetical protein n=1 Tax=Lentzea sp. NBRC 105346 TaxID=3032205 RepID=UPI0024A06D99|nr:hypothetical protein [Lentzea sp. NBRC 105346]GLZ36211.1 hypothetical protein Lesp02_83980 [Lentzea sp. NBRC 105346]
MFVTYMPEGAEETRWEFAASEVTASQAEEIEKSYGATWDKFLVEVFTGGIRARRHLLWHLMRTEHPTVLYIDTPDFRIGELECEFDKSELAAMRDKLAQDKSVDPAVLAHLDAEIETAPEGTAGKAHLNRSARRMDSRSRGSSTSRSKPKR